MFAHHCQRQRAVEAGRGAGFLPAHQGQVEALQREGVGALFGGEEIGHQLTQAGAPFGRCGVAGEGPPGGVEPFEQLHQGAEQRGVEAADFIEGLDVVPGAAGGSDRVAEEHPAQAEQPGVAFGGVGQAEAFAVFGVQAPADFGAVDPALQER